MAHKIVPPRYYVINVIVIGILMAATVMAAKMPMFHASDNPNGWNLLIALGIAALKAACIVAIFMGAYFSTNMVRMLSIAGFAWLVIFFLFTLTDYVNPLEELGTPYRDVQSPGAAPLPGGQSFAVHGREEAPASGGDYVPPPHLFEGGHGEETGHSEGASAAHDTGSDVVDAIQEEAEADPERANPHTGAP